LRGSSRRGRHADDDDSVRNRIVDDDDSARGRIDDDDSIATFARRAIFTRAWTLGIPAPP
jgi:hypothetical protein